MQYFLKRVLDDVCDEEVMVGRNEEETKRALLPFRSFLSLVPLLDGQWIQSVTKTLASFVSEKTDETGHIVGGKE